MSEIDAAMVQRCIKSLLSLDSVKTDDPEILAVLSAEYDGIVSAVLAASGLIGENARLAALAKTHGDNWNRAHETCVTLRERVAELESTLRWFLDDERFQVAVGGNPNVVEKMLSDARAALAGTTP
jgi:hypothetical protein